MNFRTLVIRLIFVVALFNSQSLFAQCPVTISSDDAFPDISFAVVDGNPAVVYYGDGSNYIKYVRANDSQGSSWPEAVDVVRQDADWLSQGFVNLSDLVTTRDDTFPAFAYFDPINRDLKIINANDETGMGRSWNPAFTIDSEGSVGRYPTMVFDDSLFPRPGMIAYHGGDTGLKIVYGVYDDWNPPQEINTFPSMGPLAGYHNTMAFVDGTNAVAYYDMWDGCLKYVRSDWDQYWEGPRPVEVDCPDSVEDIGYYASMTVVDGKPAISYVAEQAHELRFVRALDTRGTEWDDPIVLDEDSGFFDTSLAVINGVPVVAYGSWPVKIIKALDAGGTAWGTPTVIDEFGVGPVAVADVDGEPAVAYSGEDGIRFSRGNCSSGSPPASAPSLSIGDITSSSIALNWFLVTDATGYELLRESTQIYRGPNRAKTDTGLQADTQYCYKVRAYNDHGNGEYSDPPQCATTEGGGHACEYSLSSATETFGFTGGTRNVWVTTDNDCEWALSSDTDWLTVEVFGDGVGSGMFSVAASLNLETTARTGRATVTGSGSTVDVTVHQDEFDFSGGFDDPPGPVTIIPSTTRVVPGQAVTFTSHTTNATHFQWEFRDEFGAVETSDRQHTRHVFDAPGTYTVWLRVWNEIHSDPIPGGPVYIEVVQSNHTMSGVVRGFDGGPIPWDGRVSIGPTWWGGDRPWGRSIDFDEGNGTWQVGGLLPSGVYEVVIYKSGVLPGETVPVQCPGGDPENTQSGFVYFLTLDEGAEDFEILLDCSVPDTAAVFPEWFGTCLLSFVDAIPGVGALSAVWALQMDLEAARKAADRGDLCEAAVFGTAVAYDIWNLGTEAIAVDQVEDLFGIVFACLEVPAGLASCDLSSMMKSVDTGDAPLFEGVTPSWPMSALTIGGDTGDLAVRVQDPHDLLLSLSPAGEVNGTMGRGVILNGDGIVTASLVKPGGLESVTIENRGPGAATVSLSVMSFGAGTNSASEFNTVLESGAMLIGDWSEMANSGVARLQNGMSATPISASTNSTSANFRRILPATAHAEGAQGSIWRTDVVLANPSESEAQYRLSYYLPGIEQPVSASAGAVAPRGTVRLGDVVESELKWGQGGNGWLEFVSRSPLLSIARTYSIDDEGTQGQVMPALVPDDAAQPMSVAVSAKKVAGFRSNLGFVNPGYQYRQFSLSLVGDDGTPLGSGTWLLHPFEQFQLNDVVRRLNPSTNDLESGRVQVASSHAGLIAYGSIIDNATNDPMTLIPQGYSEFFVPAVAEVDGAHGSQWRTQLRFHPSDPSVRTTFTLTLYPSGESRTIALNPPEQVLDIDSIFETLGSTQERGMLHVGASQEVFPYCRIFSIEDDETRGQGIPVVPSDDDSAMLANGESGHLIGLQSSPDYRTNVAVQNYGSVEALVELELFLGDGGSSGSIELWIPPRSFWVRNSVLPREFGIDNVPVARIEVRCLQGEKVGAYASLVDNRTNDATFLPMLRLSGSASSSSPPSPPSSAPTLTATAISSSQIDLSWTAVNGATGYKLYRGSSLIYDGPNRSYSHIGLIADTQYCYTVQAYNSAGTGPALAQRCVTTDQGTPSSAPELTVIGTTSTEVSLSWTAVPGATSYKLYRGSTLIHTGPGRQKTDSGLDPNTQYCYTVLARNSVGDGPFSDVVCGTTQGETLVCGDWEIVADTGTNYYLYGVTWDNGQFVAVGDGGAIVTSTDGESWTPKNTGISKSLRRVAYGSDRFVAVGEGGTVLTSTDGSTWSPQAAYPSELMDVSWVNGRFIITGSGGTVMESPDGLSWTQRTSGTDYVLNGAVWDGTRFVIVGSKADRSDGIILVSSNAVAWSIWPSGQRIDFPLYDIVSLGDGHSVAVGGSEMILHIDPNTTQPTSLVSPAPDGLYSIDAIQGRYGAAGRSGYTITSPDGVSWSLEDRAITWDLYGIALGGTVNVAVGRGGRIVRQECGP